MKFKDVAELDEKGLKSKLKELELELMKENSQVAVGTVPQNPGKIREIKKTIARIKTAQRRGQ